MATQTLCFKEHGGINNNPMGQLSSTTSAPWWSAYGSQSVYEHLRSEDQLTRTKNAGSGTEEGLDKGTVTPFAIFPGDCKNSGDGQKPQVAISLQSVPSEYRAHFDVGFGQPMICTKYPYMDQCYGLFSGYGPQIPGRIMLPLNLTTDEGPIFVNAKQYYGIIRRRQSRAKAAERENKVSRGRKPYMHYSRHLHAMRRPRGCGGRFLNTTNSNNETGRSEVKKAGDQEVSQRTGSSYSEVLQAEGRALNASREANGNGSYLCGSEVTSTYDQGELERRNHLRSSIHSFSDVMDNQHRINIPNKWGAGADGCCTLKV